MTHNFFPKTPKAAHMELLSSPTRHIEPTDNGPTPDFIITEETSKTFRRLESIELDDLKNKIILETERNINMCFQKELAIFKKKCEKLITMSYENNKFRVENVEKEIRRKDSIIDQLLLDLQKVSTQCSCNPQTEVSEDAQELASMEYKINPLSNLKETKHTQNLARKKLEAPSQKGKAT